jgi:sugar lactone lactonase YvrE
MITMRAMLRSYRLAAPSSLSRALGAALIAAALATTSAWAQRPSIPPQAIVAPKLPYTWQEGADVVELPSGLEFDQVASADIDADGHLFVLHRGAEPFLEFNRDGHFVRAFGQGLFERAHSLTIDDDGFFWVSDVSKQVVMKLDRDAQVLLTLGEAGQSGEWDEAAGTRRFDQPTDVAIAANGDIFVTQGHSAGEPRVLKFDRSGRFIKSWGMRGTLPWEFVVAHSIVIDAAGLLYIGDRENRRIQIYNADGEFLKGWVYRGMACSLYLADDGYLYMTTGFDAQLVKLDLNGQVLGVIGAPGEGANGFGEAHDLVVGPDGRIYISDVVNRRLVSYRPRGN